MNAHLEAQIAEVITSAKNLASQYEEQPVLYNNTENTNKQVYDAFAAQVNYTQKFLAKKKDLIYLLTILNEAKFGVSNNTPSGQKVINKLNGYIETLKGLIKVYQTIEDAQYWNLTYYNKGGGLQA